MEDETTQQQSEESREDTWRTENHEAASPAPKNPDTTPTSELVADYEALLAELKVMKVNHDDQLEALAKQRLEIETGYAEQMRGRSTEAAKLLATVAKRLNWPMNGRPEPSTKPSLMKAAEQHYPSGHNAKHPGGRPPFAGTAGNPARPCPICKRQITATGWHNHQQAHINRGEVNGSPQPLGRQIASNRIYSQGMSDAMIATSLAVIRKHQPVKGKEFSQHLGKHDAGAYLSGLKERGLVKNENALWTLTEKGARLATA